MFLTACVFQTKAQGLGSINIWYRNKVVAGNQWDFDVFAKGGTDYISPEQNNFQFINLRMDIGKLLTITSFSTVFNPTYTTSASVQTSVPGTAPAGSVEMGLGFTRTGQSDIPAYPSLLDSVLLGHFTIIFSGPISSTDTAKTRGNFTATSGSFWTNNSAIPGVGSKRTFSQPSSMTLPITFNNFTGSNVNCSALLKWSTSYENNSSYYSVESSTDGINYKEAKRVASKNAITGANYSASVPLESGTNFYRIKAVDFDGISKKTSVVTIKNTCLGAATIGIYPNPTTNTVTVYGLHGRNTLDISNEVGQKMATILNTTNSQVIPAASYPSGTYIIGVVNQDGTSQNIKFVKK